MAASQNFRPIYPLQIGSLTIPCYAALASLILNLIVAIALTPAFNAIHAVRGEDETRAEHYV
jgi:solute:Na+ symporter, SSS family